MKKILAVVLVMIISVCMLVGCDEGTATTTYDTRDDITNTSKVASSLAEKQPTPTDINYSLERYNLIRRAYWVNGQREKADALVCEIEKPLGYIALFTNNGVRVGKIMFDGKVCPLPVFLYVVGRNFYVVVKILVLLLIVACVNLKVLRLKSLGILIFGK